VSQFRECWRFLSSKPSWPSCPGRRSLSPSYVPRLVRQFLFFELPCRVPVVGFVVGGWSQAPPPPFPFFFSPACFWYPFLGPPVFPVSDFPSPVLSHAPPPAFLLPSNTAPPRFLPLVLESSIVSGPFCCHTKVSPPLDLPFCRRYPALRAVASVYLHAPRFPPLLCPSAPITVTFPFEGPRVCIIHLRTLKFSPFYVLVCTRLRRVLCQPTPF